MIFVTGFHRAGTHEIAERIAVEGLYISEDQIRWDCWDAILGLSDGFLPMFDEKGFYYRGPKVLAEPVIQCPGLAHRVLDMAKLGKVYWCVRNRLDVITSMRNAGINEMAWHLMKGFHETFPDDPIWETLEYDGRDDVFDGFVRYYKLLVEVKSYFFEKYFKHLCEIIELEKVPGYDREKSMAGVHPLKDRELRAIQ